MNQSNQGLQRWQNFFLTLVIVVGVMLLDYFHKIDAQATIAILGAAIPTGALIHHQTNNDTQGNVAQEGPTASAVPTDGSTGNSQPPSDPVAGQAQGETTPPQSTTPVANVPPFNG